MKIQVILSIVAILVLVVVVGFVMVGQSSTQKVHRSSAADNAFATLKAQ
jgi:hypothetical protein